jgi:superfamily II DNA or RNA helicase
VSGYPETDEQRRRRMGQTKFGGQGGEPRQQRLTTGERTFGGELYLPPSEVKRVSAPSPPPRMNPPGPRVTEFGAGGLPRAPRVTVPPPSEPVGVRREQHYLTQPQGPRPERAFDVRPIPPEVTRNWRQPAHILLRPNQVEAVRLFHERHKGRVLYPTGVGKTEIAIAVINDLRLPAVVVAPTLVLVNQWLKRLAGWGIAAGVWTGERKDPSYVTISTYQSLFSDPALIRRFPLVVFDEAHMASSDEFRALVVETQNHPYALALTATDPPDIMRREVLNRYLPILAKQTPGEAIEAGQLTPVVVEPVATPLSGSEQTDYDKLSQTLTRTAQAMGTGNPARVVRLLGTMDHGKDAALFLRALSQRRLLLSNVTSKKAALLQVVRANPRQRILLFSESVPAVTAMCEYLRAHGIGCQVLSGETNEKARDMYISGWGVTFFVLGSVHVLQLGFDVPEVGVAVFVASGVGKLQLTQRLGRILRLAPGKTHATAYVLYAPDTSEDTVVSKLRRLAGQTIPDRTKRMDDFQDEEN